MCRSLATTRSLASQVEPGLTIQPIDALMVGLPALPTQQHEDPAEAIADARGSDLLDPLKQWVIMFLLGLVVPRRAALFDYVAGAAHTDAVTVDQMAHERLALRGPQSFFDSTSCNMTLSRLRSATSCLSLRFSSSS